MFGIIHFYTEEIAELGNLTSPNKKEYAEKHGYKLFEFTKKNELNLSKTLYNSQFYNPDYLSLIWAKIWLTKKLINENPEIEWFFYIDADAIFMNFKKKLEDFISEKAFFIIGRDCNGINAGVFFVKNCDKSKRFLQEIWDHGPEIGKNWWSELDQGIIDKMSLKEEYFDGFWTVNNNLFNSYLHECKSCGSGVLPCETYNLGDFVIHLPGVTNKVEIIKKAINYAIK